MIYIRNSIDMILVSGTTGADRDNSKIMLPSNKTYCIIHAAGTRNNGQRSNLNAKDPFKLSSDSAAFIPSTQSSGKINDKRPKRGARKAPKPTKPPGNEEHIPELIIPKRRRITRSITKIIEEKDSNGNQISSQQSQETLIKIPAPSAATTKETNNNEDTTTPVPITNTATTPSIIAAYTTTPANTTKYVSSNRPTRTETEKELLQHIDEAISAITPTFMRGKRRREREDDEKSSSMSSSDDESFVGKLSEIMSLKKESSK
ncbi:hypothetical protein BDA99DRAFT_536526 [Phascolomyces articulosus]|uniref:Uncharacterized protein n=1 Tax=Phascolomyces articulosus TaxID=60185 RepID=A0AAD5K1P1_9FUNG|nr:hypothetical protein BDA99DRAFT_536526 [Phascolomyces articulosus]